MRISDLSSDVCSSDLAAEAARIVEAQHPAAAAARPRERDVEVVVDTHRRVGWKHPQTAGHAQVQQRAAGGGVEQQVLGAAAHRVDALARQSFGDVRSEEHTSELQSLMRISYAVFCLKKKKTKI